LSSARLTSRELLAIYDRRDIAVSDEGTQLDCVVSSCYSSSNFAVSINVFEAARRNPIGVIPHSRLK
jgi:hypothetical protein